MTTIITRIQSDGTGHVVRHGHNGEIFAHIKWARIDDMFRIRYLDTRREHCVRQLTPEYLDFLNPTLSVNYMEIGLAPMFFGFMGEMDNDPMTKVVIRDDGAFDSLADGVPIDTSNVSRECQTCGESLCPFKLQGCYTECDKEVSLNTIKALRKLYVEYCKWWEHSPEHPSLSHKRQQGRSYSVPR